MRAIRFLAILGLLVPACAQHRNDDATARASAALSGPDVSSVHQLPGCVSKLNATTWLATFGYENRASKPVAVPVGTQNGFSPIPAGRGQPERFDPGKHAGAFSVVFDGNSLSWTLGTAKLTVSSATAACAAPAAAATPALNGFVLYASTMLRIDRAKVFGGDVGVAQVGKATDGRDELSVEPDAIISPAGRAFAATIDLRARALLGTVFTNRLDNQGGTVAATGGTFPVAAMPAVPTLPAVSAGTTGISVPQGQSKTLGPGAYGLIHVDGLLTLTGGAYQLARLELGVNGRVEASAAAKLRVAGAISVGPSAHLRTSPVGAARDLLIEVLGSGSEPALFMDSDSEVHALVTAPNGQILIHPRAHATGAFVAHDINLNADAVVQYEGGLPGRAADCMAALQISSSDTVPNQDPNDLPRMIAATACFAPDSTSCEVMFLANVNFDYRAAAKQLLADTFSPAQYLALSRDRSRKLLLMRKDPTWAPAFCRGDADGDLVPDDRDACPGTPPLTATDDRGCTNATLPPAPDRTKVQNGLANLGFLASTTCNGAQVPSLSFVRDVCLDRINLQYRITVEKPGNQPDACGLYYEMRTFVVEEGEPDENFSARLAFEKGQAVAQTADTVTFALPLTCDPSVETKGDGKSWPCDEADGDEFDTVIAVRVTNGNGQQSVWSGARQTMFHLCQ